VGVCEFGFVKVRVGVADFGRVALRGAEDAGHVRIPSASSSIVATADTTSHEPCQKLVDGNVPQIVQSINVNLAWMLVETAKSGPSPFPEKRQEETGKP
jgi:hypothetical protein